MSDLIPRKKCPDCGLAKPIDQFGQNKRMVDGGARYCKECSGQRSKASYRKRMAQQGRQVRERPEVPDGSKYCPRYREVKEISEFGRNRTEKSGRAAYCKPCHNMVMAENKIKNHGSVRGYHLQCRYGLTEAEVETVAERQGGLCLICLHRRGLHLDHDHASGDYRGLLCFRCNGGLGQFGDDTAIMRRAVDYLEGRLGSPLQPRASDARRVRGERKSRRHYRVVARYRIGQHDVERLIERQGGICPICRKAAPMAVDHDHVTGAVRGILCADCNTGMGQLHDDPWVLRRAIEYLTGGLLGLSCTDQGAYDVTVVRPRQAVSAVDPGWDIDQIGGYDLAVLRALARGDSGDPWESDVGVAGTAGTEPSELRFPALDLREPLFDVSLSAEPPAPLECAFS